MAALRSYPHVDLQATDARLHLGALTALCACTTGRGQRPSDGNTGTVLGVEVVPALMQHRPNRPMNSGRPLSVRERLVMGHHC